MKKRVISTGTLLFTCVSAIIGSGWLFSAYYGAIMAGPLALVSWLIGAVAIIIVAFTFAELSAFVPVTGASIRVPHYTHGLFVSFIFSWIIWVTYFSLMAVEVQAIIQYGSFFYPDLVLATGALTEKGYIAATGLMLLISIINFYSLRWLLRCNNFLTLLKIIIPLIICLVIVVAQYPVTHDHLSQMQFAPHGFKGALIFLTTGGVVFAFNGFRQATEMAGEAKDPQRSLPIAIVGGVLVCFVVYIALQYAFLVSVGSDSGLLNWSNLSLSGINSPFAIVLTQEKLHAWLPLLYVGAVVGPFAAGLMNGSSAARSLYAISKNGTIPESLALLNKKGLPTIAILVNFVLGMSLFAPFPGWKSMASFLTSLMALTYIISPVCLLTLRLKLPDHANRQFKLPWPVLWNGTAFYICALFVYWIGWDILQKLFVALFIGFVILISYRLSKDRKTAFQLDWKHSAWIWVFFIGSSIISHFGSFGGTGVLPFGWDFLAVALLSALSLWLAVKYAYSPEKLRREIDGLLAENHEE